MMGSRARLVAWLAVTSMLVVGGYVTLAWQVLGRMPADFVVGDYVYEHDEPRSDFPIASPVREVFFALRGREEVVTRMRSDALLRVLPLTLYLDVSDRFPARLERAREVVASTFCTLSKDQRDAAVLRIRPSGRQAELVDVTRCAGGSTSD